MFEPRHDLFRVLADPTRRGLYERLALEGELTVRALTDGGAVSQPAVSQHLKALKEAGLVTEQRSGRNVLYSAQPDGLRPLIDWMAIHAALWRNGFERLETLLDEMDP
jgi:DNA-binding transcriptional ArsR family regulator